MKTEAVAHRIEAGMHVVTLVQASHAEHFVTASPVGDEQTGMMFGRVAAWLRETGARVVSQEVFGVPSEAGEGMRTLAAALGYISWPVTWIEEGCELGGRGAGTQLWAVSSLPVQPIELNGKVAGCVFEDRQARYCRLGGIVPADASWSCEEQARNVFEQMADALTAADMAFGSTVRTWFYNNDILEWYNGFNEVRDAFFEEKGVFGKLVPASTAVGGRNASGTALIGELLAVAPKDGAVQVAAVPSPLQGPALAYGSGFSRATELVLTDHRRLFVSGTASISPEGLTLHVGDAAAQVVRTMEVVGAILGSRGMTWHDVSRAIAYFKRAEYIDCFERHCATGGFAQLPVVTMRNDICRDDLLFEIEVDALAAK